MKKHIVALFLSVILLLSLTLVNKANAATSYPTSATQTLLTSVAPENATLGQALSWFIWTDPPLPGQLVTLKIVDLNNNTIIYNNNENLRSLPNGCGSMVKTPINTNGFKQHIYDFIANITIGNMKIESHRNVDFTPVTPSAFYIYMYASPSIALVGDNINLTISDYRTNPYGYIDATANLILRNATKPSIWTLKNIAIPASNGSRIITIPSSLGITAGIYTLQVNGTSTIGNNTASTSFTLKDIILNVDTGGYIGQPVNASIRTYSTVPQVGLNITYQDSNPPYLTKEVVNQYVTLMNGKATISFNSVSWPEAFFTAMSNATIGSRKVNDMDYFSLSPFSLDSYTDKTNYVLGSNVNLTIQTTPQQAGAMYSVSVINYTSYQWWKDGPSSLDSTGHISKIIPAASWPVGNYYVYVTVNSTINNTLYQQTDTNYFYIINRKFNIYAILPSLYPSYYYGSLSGYVMPVLNITTSPGQTNANISIQIYNSYKLDKTGFDVSSYQYLLPFPVMKNGTYSITVSVKSSIGTNSTTAALIFYSHNKDADGDGLPDLQEFALGTDSHNPDSDGDGFFDGMEVFHGSNPLSAVSIIPEFSNAFLLMMLLAFLSPLYLIFKRRLNWRYQRINEK